MSQPKCDYSIVSLKISEVKPYSTNAKIHSESQILKLATLIEKFGWDQPIVVDGSGVVIKGHGRLFAAQKLGLSNVPCIVREDMSKEDVLASRIADNKIAETPWNQKLLKQEFEFCRDTFAYDDEAFIALGFDSRELSLVEWVEGDIVLKKPAEPTGSSTEHVCPECAHEWEESNGKQ